MKNELYFTGIPTEVVGPIYFAEMHDLKATQSHVEITPPMTTYETPLFHSV